MIVEVEYLVTSIESFLTWEEKAEKQNKRITLSLRHPKADGTKDNDHWSSMQYRIVLTNPKDEYTLGDTVKLCLSR